MTNYYDDRSSFVAADRPTPAPMEQTSLIRRGDVVQSVNGLIEAYSQQQRSLLTQAQGETIDAYQTGGRTSSAAELAERRRTARLYLTAQTFTTAITVGGLSYLAHLAGALDRPGALAVWMFGTGAISLALIAIQHRGEQHLTPEAIAHAEINAQTEIAALDAESRQIIAAAYADAIRAGADADRLAAESRKQAAANDAARLAAQFDRRTDDRRRQRSAIFQAAEVAPPPAVSPYEGRVETAPAVTETDPRTVATVSATDPTVSATAAPAAPTDPTLAVLLGALATLYETVDPANPLIKIALPWSARSTAIPPKEKERITDLLGRLEPPLITQAAGGRYYLNFRDYSSARRTARILANAWQ